MKHLSKSTIFITFAITIASVFTSCGNDNELFEEPIMYRTRAMAGMTRTIEPPKQQYVTNCGPSKATFNIRVNEAHIEVNFQWSSGVLSYIYMDADEPVIIDENSETMYDNDYKDQYFYTYKELKKDPVRLLTTDPYLTIGNFGKTYLAVDVAGTVIEYRYNRNSHKSDTIPHDISGKYVSEIPLEIELRDNPSSYNPTFNNPKSESNDSLTIQKQ